MKVPLRDRGCRVLPVLTMIKSMGLNWRVSVRLSNSIQNKPTSYQKPLKGVPCTPSSKSRDLNGSGSQARCLNEFILQNVVLQRRLLVELNNGRFFCDRDFRARHLW